MCQCITGTLQSVIPWVTYDYNCWEIWSQGHYNLSCFGLQKIIVSQLITGSLHSAIPWITYDYNCWEILSQSHHNLSCSGLQNFIVSQWITGPLQSAKYLTTESLQLVVSIITETLQLEGCLITITICMADITDTRCWDITTGNSNYYSQHYNLSRTCDS